MGRAANARKPFRFIWNQSAAVATNLYLLLYPKRALRAALAAKPKAQAKLYRALREIDAGNLIGHGRVYGGGLYKLEPKELGRIPVRGIMAAAPLDANVGRQRPASGAVHGRIIEPTLRVSLQAI